MTSRLRTKEERDARNAAVVARYQKCGSITLTARAFGLNESTVTTICKQQGIKLGMRVLGPGDKRG